MTLLLLACLAPTSTPLASEREPLVASPALISTPPADPVLEAAAGAYRSGTLAFLTRGLEAGDFRTGNALFDREWLFGTWMMAAMGLGQHALTHPEDRAEDLVAMEICLDRLLGAESRAFDASSWGMDPLESLASDQGHAAYLGYTALPLGLHRLLVPDSRFAATHDALIDAIDRRLAATDSLVETYPRERYPVDNAAMIGALGLHRTVTGTEHAEIARWIDRVEERYLDASGLLYQSAHDGTPSDAGRGSGSFLAAWFLSWADPTFGATLYGNARDTLSSHALGVAGMREYAPGIDGRGDIDSGPIVLGLGVSSTGFAIGSAGRYGDQATARSLTRTATLAGSLILTLDPSLLGPPTPGSASGSAIGDAILFAMMSSPPALGESSSTDR